jgi:hypothetical protein
MSETLSAVGSSMFPCVPSGSRLQLAAVQASQVRVGDIVAYVGRAGMVAPRVVSVDAWAACPVFVMRGDAQEATEVVSGEAVAYRVTRVSYAGVSYATAGPLGRLLSQLAVERGRPFRWLRHTALQLAGAHRYWKRHQAQSA